MGDKYLRRLLVVGMTSLVKRAKHKPNAVDPKLADLLNAKAGSRGHGRTC
jgi:transposase